MEKRRAVVPAKKDEIVDKSRRRFLKNAILTSFALAGGCYLSDNKSTRLCETREIPWENSDSKEIIMGEWKSYTVGAGETTQSFAGYRVRVDSISIEVGETGREWDRDVSLSILDDEGNLLESGIVLNPVNAPIWTSSGGVVILASLAVLLNERSWTRIEIYNPHSKVNEDWTVRGVVMEEEQTPDCETVAMTRKTTAIELNFSPGLTADRNYDIYPVKAFIIPVNEVVTGDNLYLIGEVLTPSESAEGKGMLSLWKKEENMPISEGMEHEFSTLKISVISIPVDSEGISASFRITDNASGHTTDFVNVRTGEGISYNAPDGKSHYIYPHFFVTGDRLGFFVFVLSEPLLLADGERAVIDGKTYRVSMDYNPEGTEIRAVYLDLEE